MQRDRKGSYKYIKKKTELSITSNGSSNGSTNGQDKGERHRRAKGKLVPLNYNI